MTTSDPSEADVEAAQELYQTLIGPSFMDYDPGLRHSLADVRAIAAALASARAEGEAAGAAKEREATTGYLLEWASATRDRAVRTGDSDDAVEHDTLVSVRQALERGDHLRALTPEGKR